MCVGEGFQLTPNYSIPICGKLNSVTIWGALHAHAHARILMKATQHVKEFSVFKNKKRIIIIIIIIIIITTNYNFGF